MGSALHTLYRFYNTDNALIYVGLTANLPARLSQHRADKPWWAEVGKIEVEHYPDRETVRVAEQAAIEAEQPLYNVTYNPTRPSNAVKATAALSAQCMTCETPIVGKEGVIHVGMREVYAVLRARREWQRENNPDGIPRAMNLKTLMELPDDVAWLVQCNPCIERADPDHDCGGCYWFWVGRCTSWPALMHWTTHLSGKEWLDATNWMDWCNAIANGSRGSGLISHASREQHVDP